jgi:hypothetical protein
MSYSLSLTQNQSTATLVVTLTESVFSNFLFSFDVALDLDGARSNGIDLLSSAEVANQGGTVNGRFTGSTSGTFIGPIEAGTALLAYEFTVQEAGSITVTSFAATRNEILQTVPALPQIDLVEPGPLGAAILDGAFEVGGTLTVNTSALPDFSLFSRESAEYTWFRNGTIVQSGEGPGFASYAVTEADLGAEISVRVSYRDFRNDERIVVSTDNETVGTTGSGGSDPNGPNEITGNDDPTLFETGGGDDTIIGLGGDDTINGQDGIDTAVFSGPQSSYTLTLSPDGITLQDRRSDGDGTDRLISVERLKFDGDAAIPPVELDKLDGAVTLSAAEMNTIIELYIAYFNRAPDAIGLNFWANAYADGTSIERMAELFAPQPETVAAYPPGTSNLDFATIVYNNVLGRTPDEDGLTFWVDALDSGMVTRDRFILEVLKGANGPAQPERGPDFVAQQEADRLYLETKTDIGAYFAVHLGMSDVDNARTVMDSFDGALFTEADARAQADFYYQFATGGITGEFLMPLVGVLTDDFTG